MRPKFTTTDGNYLHLQRKITSQCNHSKTHYFLIIVLPFLYCLLYGIGVSSHNNGIFLFCYILLGVTLVPIFLFLIHEAVHGVLFKSKKSNQYFLYFFDFLGANSYIFQKRHNLSHHNYANVQGWDTDIEQSGPIKLYPHGSPQKWQKYQYIGVFLLYPLYVFNWILIRDFRDFFNPKSIIRKFVKIPTIESVKLIVFKLFYFFYMIGIPIIVGLNVWVVILAFLCFTMVASMLALIVLIPPHVTITNDFPLPKDNTFSHSWMLHQLTTTNNIEFPIDFVSMGMARFNFHVAHHLFPSVPWYHLKKISKQLEQYCEQYDLPYTKLSLWEALKRHYQLVKKNGNQKMLDETL